MSFEQIIALLAFGAGLLLLREVQFRIFERTRASLPRLQGRVTACNIRPPTGLRFCYETWITYKFELDGERRTARDVVLSLPWSGGFERALSWSEAFPVGAPVTLVPNRSHPERSRLERDMPRMGWRRPEPIKPSSY